MLLLSLLIAQMVVRRDCSSAIEEWTREVLTLSGYDQSLFLHGEVAQVIRHNAYPWTPLCSQQQSSTRRPQGPGCSAAQAASGTGLAGSVPGLLAAATVTGHGVTWTAGAFQVDSSLNPGRAGTGPAKEWHSSCRAAGASLTRSGVRRPRAATRRGFSSVPRPSALGRLAACAVTGPGSAIAGAAAARPASELHWHASVGHFTYRDRD